MELHRKVFDVLEYEITEFSKLLNETQGILNSSSTAASSQSQSLSGGRIMMPRSVSTPVIAQPSSSTIRGTGNFGQPQIIGRKCAEFGSGFSENRTTTHPGQNEDFSLPHNQPNSKLHGAF